MWEELIRAAALIMVIEGLMPFISPRRFREALARFVAVNDRWMRAIGLAAMLIGLLILAAVK